MLMDTNGKKTLLERMQKYESLIAGSVLVIGLSLLAAFLYLFWQNAKAELNTFEIRTSSTRWEVTGKNIVYPPQEKIQFVVDPHGKTVVSSYQLLTNVFVTADSLGHTVLVDENNKKVDSAVFISDSGNRITATFEKDHVVFTNNGNELTEFHLDGYVFNIHEKSLSIDGYEVFSYENIAPSISIPTTTTTTTATTTVTTTTTKKATTTPPPTTTTTKRTTPKTTTTKKTTTLTTTKETKQSKTSAVLPTTKKPQTQTSVTTKKAVTTAAPYKTDDVFLKEVLRLINLERSKAGVKQLKGMIALDKAANIRAHEITGDDENFSHTRPHGKEFYTVLFEQSIEFMAAGENLAAGQSTPEMVVADWMASEGHKANILDPDFEYVGLGYVEDDGYYYWAQLFIGG